MKKCYIALFFSVFLFSGCYEWPDNGDLDGMWQLTEWRDKGTNQVIATNASGLYYCFQHELMKYQFAGHTEYHFSYFTNTGDSLLVGKTVAYPAEEECPITELAPYGVPSDGGFRIDVLSGNRMQLSTNEHTLTFRKY